MCVHVCMCSKCACVCVCVGAAALVKPVCLAEERGEGLNLAEGTKYPKCGLGRIPGGDL